MRSERFISIPKAARMCGLSPSVFRKLVDDGVIPATRPSAHLRVKTSDVERHLRDRAESPIVLDQLTAEERQALA